MMLKNSSIQVIMIKMIKDHYEKNKKVLGRFKNELGGKIMNETAMLRAKAYVYITEDGSVHKRAKGMKKCIIKREIMFEH